MSLVTDVKVLDSLPLAMPNPSCHKNISKYGDMKKQNITLPTKVCIGKAFVFPVIMYRCERVGA